MWTIVKSFYVVMCDLSTLAIILMRKIAGWFSYYILMSLLVNIEVSLYLGARNCL